MGKEKKIQTYSESVYNEKFENIRSGKTSILGKLIALINLHCKQKTTDTQSVFFNEVLKIVSFHEKKLKNLSQKIGYKFNDD